MTKTIAVWSESGGVGKTTTAVSLAYSAAELGHQVLLIDLDPRAAASKWLRIDPTGPGLHVGAILADEDPEGWADELAVQSTWHPNLRVIPSDRSVTNREAEKPDGGEVRLRTSLEGTTADYVFIDCPNRQGGLLTLNALMAADAVVYAAIPSEDGMDGIEGAAATLETFATTQRKRGSTIYPRALGAVMTSVRDTIPTRVERYILDTAREEGTALIPFVPQREAVRQARVNGDWYGQDQYNGGRVVVDAYAALAQTIIEEVENNG